MPNILVNSTKLDSFFSTEENPPEKFFRIKKQVVI